MVFPDDPHVLLTALIVLLCFGLVLACGPTPQANYTFDFNDFNEKSIISNEGYTYTISPCKNAVSCYNSIYASSVCLVPITSFYSIGLTSQTNWSYINNDPTQGVQLYAVGETYAVPSCSYYTTATSTVKFVCSSGSGDDSITINQYGSDNGGLCDWIFTVNSKIVCQILQPNTTSSTSSSSSSSAAIDSSGIDSSGGGTGSSPAHDDPLVIIIILLLIIIFLLFCLLVNRVGFT